MSIETGLAWTRWWFHFWQITPTCAMVKSRYIGDGHPTSNRNPYNGYVINPYGIGLMSLSPILWK